MVAAALRYNRCLALPGLADAASGDELAAIGTPEQVDDVGRPRRRRYPWSRRRGSRRR